MKADRYQKLRTILYFMVITMKGTVCAQLSTCFNSLHHYKVDLEENNGNGTSGSTYHWEVIGTFLGTLTPITPSENQIEIDWGATPVGSYTLKVTETNSGCSVVTFLEISITPELDLEVANQLICPDSGIATFEAGIGYSSYTWYNSDGEIIGNEHSLTVEEVGVYTLEVENGDCFDIVEIEALPMEFPQLTVNTDAFNTIIVDQVGGNINIEFQLEDFEGNTIRDWQVSNTFYNIPEGIYIVRIRSWDASCMTFVFATTISIPNAITPNGDGYNDVWDMSRLLKYAPNARIEIYDRYGKLFKKLSASNNFTWDGKYGGQNVPSTSYIYILYLNEEKITGYILVKN